MAVAFVGGRGERPRGSAIVRHAWQYICFRYTPTHVADWDGFRSHLLGNVFGRRQGVTDAWATQDGDSCGQPPQHDRIARRLAPSSRLDGDFDRVGRSRQRGVLGNQVRGAI
jgi:hypothetical protein